MLLEMVDALPATSRVEVWLPIDLEHPAPEFSLCNALAKREVVVRHVDLPVLRRAYRNPLGIVKLVNRAAGLYRHLRLHKPRMIYCTTSAAFLGAPVARVARIPRVVGHVQELWSGSDRQILALLARACHSLVAISGAVVASLPAELRDRVQVVPNAVPDPGNRTVIEEHEGDLRYLIASRWNSWKGHRTLLEAWDLAGTPGVLIVLGGPPRSGEKVEVPALVAGLQIPDTVHVVGEVEEPATYVAAADVVLVPSDQPEPFGLVAIEAFAQGRPVIASAAGGLLDILTPNHDGWLFPPGDVQELARILSSLDRLTAATAGRHARKTYEQRYTSARFADEWLAVLLPSINDER